MEIESIRHKALRRFVETGNPKGVDAKVADRLRKMIAYLIAIETAEEMHVQPNWGAHQLTGDRAGVWSLSVTKTWRMTFHINEGGAIAGLDLEDYH